MKTYLLNTIMLPLAIKKQGDGLNSYELGHSLVFFCTFWKPNYEYIYENINVYCIVHIYINIFIFFKKDET